jgi:MerR family transcriptional regulator, light-induced transcriptional regulator
MSDTLELERVLPEALAAFQAQRLNIVRATVARSLENQAEVAQHGAQAEELLTTGLDFTTQALEVAMRLHNTDMLEYQLQWGNERLPHDGVAPEQLLHRFEILSQVIEATLPAPYAQGITPFVQWLMARQRELISAAAG